MTGEFWRVIAPGTVVLWFVLCAASFFLEARLFRQLRDHHPHVFEELGRPSSLARLRNRPVGAFLRSGRYRELGDESLARTVSAQRLLSWAHFAAFVGVLVVWFGAAGS